VVGITVSHVFSRDVEEEEEEEEKIISIGR